MGTCPRCGKQRQEAAPGHWCNECYANRFDELMAWDWPGSNAARAGTTPGGGAADMDGQEVALKKIGRDLAGVQAYAISLGVDPVAGSALVSAGIFVAGKIAATLELLEVLADPGVNTPVAG